MRGAAGSGCGGDGNQGGGKEGEAKKTFFVCLTRKPTDGDAARALGANMSEGAKSVRDVFGR